MISHQWLWKRTAGMALCLGLAVPQQAAANGGPFVLKYPNGDPAAKGVLARIDPDLKPGREERLRVIKEDLKVTFVPANFDYSAPRATGSNLPPGSVEAMQPPLAAVSAIYTIENPTEAPIEVQFGFPILRGIYIQPFSMMPSPEVKVTLDTAQIQPDLISNSMIYGLIRHRARQVIEGAIEADPQLARLVATMRTTSYIRQRSRELVQQVATNQNTLQRAIQADASLSRLMATQSDAEDPDRARARSELMRHLTGKMKWQTGPANLLAEYSSMELENLGNRPYPVVGNVYWGGNDLGEFRRLAYANLGRLGAIGEQKATQLYAELAAQFEPSTRTTYENIFQAWGGDVRERSVDLTTGKVRPRELTLSSKPAPEMSRSSDPTVYARMDYINPNFGLTAAEKVSCETILKHLPVTFTFAPMNLVHYQVTFPAKSTRTLTVAYKQYAYLDTAQPPTFQLAYVVHPASLWKEFGPIHLEVAVPAVVNTGVSRSNAPFVQASVPMKPSGTEQRDLSKEVPGMSPNLQPTKMAIYEGTVTDKTGELFLGINAGVWKTVADPNPKLGAK